MNPIVCKTLSLLLLFTAFIYMNGDAQQPVNNYDAQWKKVDELVRKRLPQSALTEVRKIYTQAKKEKQEAQLIKSLVYIGQLQDENREDNDVQTIREYEKELAENQGAARAIISNLLADTYLQYYNRIRWQIYERTATSDFKKEDVSTWTTGDFHNRISALYLQSIADENLLAGISLNRYDPILFKGNVRHLRPTLFDLLAHSALEYFKSTERDLKKPAFAFTLDQDFAFFPAADFVNRQFVSRDTMSLHHKAILLYQRLIRRHLNDPKPDALLDVDIDRLAFVYAHSVSPQKDQFYLDGLASISQKYPDLPAASQALYLVARFYESKAQTYRPHGDTSFRYARVRAKEICEKVISQKDSSEGKVNCINLLAEINRRHMRFQIEKVNLPNLPFRTLVRYRNFETLHLRIIKPDDKLKNDLRRRLDDEYWNYLAGIKSIKSWDQQLPATNDLQEHLVEIKIDPLPAGDYMLIASTDKDFRSKESVLAAQIFYVSSISYINNGNDFFVLNRSTGQPLDGASVQVWNVKYDYKQSRYVNQKHSTHKVDANGYFKLPKRDEKDHREFLLDVSWAQERLFMDEQSDYYYSNDDNWLNAVNDHNIRGWFFLDRSLYRPGQTLHFKAIMAVTSKQGSIVWKKQPTKVYLNNANGERIDSLSLTTNEYGSIAGTFQLPQGTLNGQFSIQLPSDQGITYFNVEEYKRPKFQVEYEPVKGTYKVNDKITVTGIAKAYAGNVVDGGLVRYRVVRQPRFIYPWLFWRWWQPPAPEMEIAHGETKTGVDGKFTIEFTAIPDLTIDKKFEPVFDYKVYADVTDINGETRSGQKIITAGYKSLIIKFDLPEVMPIDSLKQIQIRTENMNGDFESSQITVIVTQLKEEPRLIRQRFWERPDQFTMTKAEYIRLFPYDEYDNESDPRSWEKGNKVLEKTDSTRNSGVFILDNTRPVPGFYMVEVTARDKNGEEVKDVQYVELFNENSNRPARPQYISVHGAKPVEPGETTRIRIATTADDVFLIRQTDKQTKGTVEYDYSKLDKETRNFDFTATEDDRGGYGVSFAFVKHNRFHEYTQTIVVPWSNKELSVEYATFRDNMLPGSEEKWTLKISGNKNEKVAAELLVSMYDASLDQFMHHQWSKPQWWPTYSSRKSWSGSRNFIAVYSNARYVPVKPHKELHKIYDQLIWDQNAGIYGSGRGLVKYEVQSRTLEAPATVESMMEGRVSGVANQKAKDVDADGSDEELNADKAGDQPQPKDEAVQLRKNFKETAFFLPQLKTNEDGSIEFSFTMPEALTRWKVQALAHTEDLAVGYSSKEVITQKKLMVLPSPPRFIRQGDKISFSAKISNLTESRLSGNAELQLLDASNNSSLNVAFKNADPEKAFVVEPGQSAAVIFPVEIPLDFNSAMQWRIVAKAGGFSDGEENVMPVLSNRMLVTESLPLTVRGGGAKEFNFEKLLSSGTSKTIQHHALTLEYTSNPVWYAVQSLPYLIEYPYDCAEQNWNRYYANSLATMIANSTPKIREIFARWSETPDAGALLSNLQKNQELKSVLLEETPWILQAKTEAEQKKNLALLLDMTKMSTQLSSAFEKLVQMQSENGGFVWFKGGPDDRYITQYIVTGIGHLKRLNAVAPGQDQKLERILATAIPYLDRKIKEEYDQLVKLKTDLKNYVPGSLSVQYLYMRSFFPDLKIPQASQTAVSFYKERAKQTWTKNTKYMQGMIALALSRSGDKTTPAAILKSLKETAVINEELGMYWKDVRRGWFWYENALERQALLIEAFHEIAGDEKTVDDLKTWLLKNKQTNNWESTKATAEACYALLLQGSKWLTEEVNVDIRLDAVPMLLPEDKKEAGTGYIKKTITGDAIKPGMGKISVNVSKASGSSSTSWGAVYWQYFEDLDKITPSQTPLSLVKKLFVEKNTDRGPILTPVNNGDQLQIGDKIKVRIELRVDREMEYVHMKDMRASAMEPVNVISGYKWQDGLGYYETTKDASTNFFFDHLRRGTYVFEYPLFVTHSGNFSNGITSIQCMYAPEFSAHSEGIRVTIK